MIQYINHLCNQWAIWCLSGKEKLGYPRQAAFLNGQPNVHSGVAISICDDQALQVQRAINSLDPELKRLIVLFYLHMRNCDVDTIAKSMQCATSTMYDRLHRAHQRIMDSIHDDELR